MTLAYFIDAVCWLLPAWQIWPSIILSSLSYFFGELMNFNFLVPIDSLYLALIFYLSFETAYFGGKLIMKIFNFFRGTGTGLDI